MPYHVPAVYRMNLTGSNKENDNVVEITKSLMYHGSIQKAKLIKVDDWNYFPPSKP